MALWGTSTVCEMGCNARFSGAMHNVADMVRFEIWY